MTLAEAELAREQDHYDTALEAREDHRRGLGRASGAAARPQDAREIRAAVKRIQDRLPAPEETVLFARVDLETEEGSGRTLYLGPTAVHDDDQGLLVINFNAPAAACYYKGTPANPMGMIRKRTFEVESHRLTDYEEVVLKELEEDLEALENALQGPGDSLLRDLESSRDGSMRNIARTIGAAQYDVISHPLDRLLVVQGGPGTGKTAVALHRISYWLYNTQQAEDPADRLAPTDVLVVGPSQVFTKYISRVLPGLGDGDVAYKHLRNLGPQTSAGRTESSEVATLKGDRRMAGLLARALRSRVRIPLEPLEVGPAGNQAAVPTEAIRAQVEQLSGLPYRAGREQFRVWLGETVAASRRGYTGEQVNAAVERVWPLPTPQRFVQELLASQNMLLNSAGNGFTAAEIRSLQRQPAARISEEVWSDADVALIDEIDWLMEGRAGTFKHIVVDEAQDLSDMQLRSLRRRSSNGSMTVVGDLAQSTGPNARDGWEGVISGLAQGSPANLIELELGYRVPKQVFDFAAQLLPVAAPAVRVPQVIRSGPADPELLEHDVDDVATAAVSAATAHAGRGAFVGIVCPASFREALAAALAKGGIRWSDGDTNGVSGTLSSINVVSPETAKGLEFDAVVVVEPEAIVGSDPHGLRLLYIALTRTTAHLSVVHSGRALPLPAAVAGPDHRGEDLHLFEVAQRGAISEQLPFTTGNGDVHGTGPAPAPSSRRSTPDSHEDASARPALDLSAAVVAAAAGGLADEIRGAVPAEQWPTLIDILRRELGISDEQLFELLG